MSLAVAITDEWYDGKRHHVIGTITPSGNYVTSGDTLDFSAVVQTASPPLWVHVGSLIGVIFVPVYGTGPADNKLLAYDAGGTQLTGAAAYPAGVTTVATRFYAIFPQLM